MTALPIDPTDERPMPPRPPQFGRPNERAAFQAGVEAERARAAAEDQGRWDAIMKDACTVPPAGWFCTRTKGHDGPCAALPDERARAAAETSGSGWVPGTPCASCGSRDTHWVDPGVAACRACRRTDADE